MIFELLLVDVDMRLKSVLLLSYLACSLYAADNTDRQQIQQRIQPVGSVHAQAQEDSVTPKNTTGAKQEAGQDTYEQHCIVCHRDGLAGAPKFRNESDWSARLTGKTIDDLVSSSIKGLNAMPAQGTCAECSETDLKDAIQYMLPKS